MSNKKNNKTVDIDEDVIRKISSLYSDIYDIFTSTKVQAEGYVLNAYNSYSGEIGKHEEECAKIIKNVSKDLIDILNKVGLIDESIVADFENSDYNFNDVIALLSSIRKGTKIKKADKTFFEKCPNATVTEYRDGDKTYFKVLCDGYVYDSKTSKLTMPNGKGIVVKYYVPSEYTDVSLLNTLTALPAGEVSVEGYPNMKDIAANSIIIMPNKPRGSEDISFYNFKDEVVGTTIFANKIANQKEDCQNIISGCSKGGCASLKIAAGSGDVYDTVICINNAALVTGINANKGTKEQFSSLNDLTKLDGKNIYFVSTKSDPNLYHCATSQGGWEECNSISKGYLYTGVELVSKNCPNANVYLVTNSNYSGFSNMEKKYSNLHYSNEMWSNVFGKKNYASHAEYKNVLCDLINNGFVGYNRFTDIT